MEEIFCYTCVCWKYFCDCNYDSAESEYIIGTKDYVYHPGTVTSTVTSGEDSDIYFYCKETNEMRPFYFNK